MRDRLQYRFLLNQTVTSVSGGSTHTSTEKHQTLMEGDDIVMEEVKPSQIHHIIASVQSEATHSVTG